LKIGICDDNIIDSKILESSIKKYYESKPFKLEIFTFPNGIEFLNKNNEIRDFDIIFLDIFLNDLNGFNIAKELSKTNNKVPVILYSSSKDYAIEGYQINIFGYLLKPLYINKLYKYLDKFHDSTINKVLCLKKKGQNIYFNINDIIYVESRGRQVIVHTINNNDNIFYYSLDNIEEKINNESFLRSHKSFLVNMNRIINHNERYFELENDNFALIKIKDHKNIIQKYHDYIFKGN